MRPLSKKRIQHAMNILGKMFVYNRPLKERQTNFNPILLNEVSLGAICDYLQEIWSVMDESMPYLPDDIKEKLTRLQSGLVEVDNPN